MQAEGQGVPKVLIVDDDPALRDVLRFALQRDGYQTDEAADGAAALRFWRQVAAAVPGAQEGSGDGCRWNGPVLAFDTAAARSS